MEKADDYTASFCPSFSSYANNGLAETAERVRREFSGEYNDEDDDDSFEFANPRSDCEAAASFSGGCDLVFPVFNQAIISSVKPDESSRAEITTKLSDLFLRDRDDSSSSSSDEEKEIDGVSREVYGPCTPEKPPEGGWRKSKSTGSSSSSSRRWRIRDLLKRSYSEGKQSLSFLNSSSSTNREESSKEKEKKKKEEKVSSAHEKFYLKKKAKKEEEKRRSYLPYKQHLFGLFSFNVHHHRNGNTLLSS
ncbi:unnamed protein product [Eruca vesicaria subsp. sativa]|uniref:Uncharacterized protein n=1 Tax=Eruca vesicaria subsp. sativa TaxID=29727 RepID=A0ABC8IU31_ERUVS|nr:unnamed protein product [Eruca vesicaria subsp. sativa]